MFSWKPTWKTFKPADVCMYVCIRKFITHEFLQPKQSRVQTVHSLMTQSSNVDWAVSVVFICNIPVHLVLVHLVLVHLVLVHLVLVHLVLVHLVPVHLVHWRFYKNALHKFSFSFLCACDECRRLWSGCRSTHSSWTMLSEHFSRFYRTATLRLLVKTTPKWV